LLVYELYRYQNERYNDKKTTVVFIGPVVFHKDSFVIYNAYKHFINKFRTFEILPILDDLFETSSKDAARLKVKKIRN
jgi:hypothetical protein